MLTEALLDAKYHILAAMQTLEQYPRGSYEADAAHGKLGEALGAIEGGLRYFEGEGCEEAGFAVERPQRRQGGLGMTPRGEREGAPDPLPNNRDWPQRAFLYK